MLSTIAVDEFASMVCRSILTTTAAAAVVILDVAFYVIILLLPVSATYLAEVVGRVPAGLLCMARFVACAADQ